MIRTLTLTEMKDIQNEINEETLTDWKSILRPCDYNIAIMDEIGELLGSGRNFKWWKQSGDIHYFNEKIEITDILLFYVSKIILNDTSPDSYVFGLDDIKLSVPSLFDESGFDRYVLDGIIANLLKSNAYAHWIDDLIMGAGITSEEISALYTAKTTLHSIRMSTGYKDGTYVKIQDGIEDNHRMEYIIDAFLKDPSMSLNDIKTSVKNEFFVNSDV